jgi:hypothetical protein
VRGGDLPTGIGRSVRWRTNHRTVCVTCSQSSSGGLCNRLDVNGVGSLVCLHSQVCLCVLMFSTRLRLCLQTVVITILYLFNDLNSRQHLRNSGAELRVGVSTSCVSFVVFRCSLRACVCACVCACVYACARESSEREREKERESVCECVFATTVADASRPSVMLFRARFHCVFWLLRSFLR